MEILWHGNACFTLKTKTGTAVINPYQSDIGLKLPNLKADVVVISKETSEYNNVEAIAGTPKVLSWPGEYEVAGIAITAEELRQPEKKETTMLFTFDAEGLKICYLTDLNIPVTDEMVENIGEVDVLMIPVGEGKDAHQIIEEIEPRLVIPMQFKTAGIKLELPTLDGFSRQAGIATVQPKDELVLKNKSELPQDKTEFVILNPQIA